MRKVLSLFVSFFMGITMLMAQNRTVTGSVISEEDGEPVIGASVMVTGTNTGTTTDMDGNFSISVSKDAKTLTVSFVGMITQEAPIKDKMKISLASNYQVIDDVVVTALGVKRSQKALGYSATSLKAEDLTNAHATDLMSGLAGKVAGVSVRNTGDPGASTSVVIRGFTSIGQTNQPMYVVDGVPINNSATYGSEGLDRNYDFGNGASLVNPEDIENMTILKGAAATALYGSRAANGVIMITTKSGKKARKGLGVTYNGGLQWASVLRVPQAQNMFGMGWYGDKTDDENGSWGPRFDGSILKYGAIYNNSQLIKSYLPIEHNVEDFFTTGFKYTNNVSFNGATEDGKSTYYLSVMQVSDDGIIPKAKDTNKQYNFSARATHKVKDLTLSFSANYISQKISSVVGGQKESSMYNAIMQTPRDISFQNMEDLDDIFNTPGYYFTPYGVNNPYWVIENYKNTLDKSRFYGKIQLDYDFLKYFKATARLGGDASTDEYLYGAPNIEAMFGDSYNAIVSQASSILEVTGEVQKRYTRRRDLEADIMVAYDQNIASDWHVNALLGINGNERRASALRATVTNLTIPTWFDLSNSSEIPTLVTDQWKRRSFSWYGTGEIAWKESVFVSGTVRTDYSSTLPYDNNHYTYAGITGSFLWSNFLTGEAKSIVDLGKVRVAWGKTGNDADPYMTMPYFAKGAASSSGWGNSNFPFTKTGTNAYSVGNILGSNNLSPEMTTEFEAGFNVAVFQNRVNVDFAFYNRESDKQIFQLDTDPSTGYTAVNTNLGVIRNRGIELLVSGSPIRTKNWDWTLTWNFTKNKNKVVSLPEDMGGEASIYGFSGGTGLYAIEGKELGIFKATTSQKDEEGHIIVNDKGLPVAGEQVEIGSMSPDYTMGFGTALRYKSITLTVDFDFRKGGLMYSRTKNISWFTGNAIQTAYNDRNPFIVPNSVMSDGNGGYVENTIALTPKDIYTFWDNGGFDMDASDLIDKTYVKLRTVNLTWAMPAKWFKKTPIEQVTLSAYGNNLFLWTPKENTYMDPDASSFGNDLSGQFGEYSTNPSSRKYGFNLSVKF